MFDNVPCCTEDRTVAENESLDLGDAYAERWEVPLHFLRKGGPPKLVAGKAERSLDGEIRKALKQWQERGITLSNVLAARNSPTAMRELVRRSQGHPYLQLLAAAARVGGDSGQSTLEGWIHAILDKFSDQCCFRLAGTGNLQTFEDVQQARHFRPVPVRVKLRAPTAIS